MHLRARYALVGLFALPQAALRCVFWAVYPCNLQCKRRAEAPKPGETPSQSEPRECRSDIIVQHLDHCGSSTSCESMEGVLVSYVYIVICGWYVLLYTWGILGCDILLHTQSLYQLPRLREDLSHTSIVRI